jgi:divalent metal cation (Fe/Co/Zn/Cd) transporter
MEDAMERAVAADHGRQRERTARIAVLAALPTLAVTAYAALASNSLTLRADLVLTLLDAAGVLAVWLVARRMGGNGVANLERPAGALVGILMLVSSCVVAGFAALRIGQGGAMVAGGGVAAGLVINLIYGLINLGILRRCLAQSKADPSPLLRSQVRLFIDKATSNLLMVAALGAAVLFGETQIGPFIDPAASLLVAASMAFWSIQILRDSVGGWIDASRIEVVPPVGTLPQPVMADMDIWLRTADWLQSAVGVQSRRLAMSAPAEPGQCRRFGCRGGDPRSGRDCRRSSRPCETGRIGHRDQRPADNLPRRPADFWRGPRSGGSMVAGEGFEPPTKGL